MPRVRHTDTLYVIITGAIAQHRVVDIKGKFNSARGQRWIHKTLSLTRGLNVSGVLQSPLIQWARNKLAEFTRRDFAQITWKMEIMVVISLYSYVHLFVFRVFNWLHRTHRPPTCLRGAAPQFGYIRTAILFYTRSACACCKVVSLQVCMTNWDSVPWESTPPPPPTLTATHNSFLSEGLPSRCCVSS